MIRLWNRKSNDGGGRKKASNAQKLKGLFQNTNRQLRQHEKDIYKIYKELVGLRKYVEELESKIKSSTNYQSWVVNQRGKGVEEEAILSNPLVVPENQEEQTTPEFIGGAKSKKEKPEEEESGGLFGWFTSKESKAEKEEKESTPTEEESTPHAPTEEATVPIVLCCNNPIHQLLFGGELSESTTTPGVSSIPLDNPCCRMWTHKIRKYCSKITGEVKPLSEQDLRHIHDYVERQKSHTCCVHLFEEYLRCKTRWIYQESESK